MLISCQYNRKIVLKKRYNYLFVSLLNVYYLFMQTINNYLSNRKYPGRTVIAGNTKDGKLFMAYLLQGRSENSRNRVLVKKDNAIETAPKDESKVQNRDLIIYKALLEDDEYIYLTNGDHGESIMKAGDIKKGLLERTFEEDPPINTPRLGVIYKKREKVFNFFIIKKDEDKTLRIIWSYPAVAEVAHIIHTYEEDLSSFKDNPVMVKLEDTNEILGAFDNDNTVACMIKLDDDVKIFNRGE